VPAVEPFSGVETTSESRGFPNTIGSAQNAESIEMVSELLHNAGNN
jgi:hypothetical protein